MKKRLLGMMHLVRTPENRLRWRLAWSRVLSVMVILGILGVILKTAGFYYFFNKVKGYPEITLTEMIFFPLNRHEIRQSHGNYHIRMAREAMAREEYRKAFILARQGVSRAPQNLEGRLLLARFYSHPQIDRKNFAVSILEAGIPYARNDADYIRQYCRILLQTRNDEKIDQLSQTFLNENQALNSIRQSVALTAATSALERGAFRRAEILVEKYRLDTFLEGALLSTRIDWQKGLSQSALIKLETLIYQNPDEEALYALAGDYYHQLGDYKNALHKAIQRTIVNPVDPEPRIVLIYRLNDMGDQQALQEEISAFIQFFGDDPKSMQELAGFGTETGRITLNEQLYEHATSHFNHNSIFALLRVESYIVAGQASQAEQYLLEMGNDSNFQMAQHEKAYLGLQAVCHLKLKDLESADIYLKKLLQQQNMNGMILISVAEKCRTAGFEEYTIFLLNEAIKRFPDNQKAISYLIHHYKDAGDAAGFIGSLQKLLSSKRPSMQLLDLCHEELMKDKYMFYQDRTRMIRDIEQILQVGNQI